MKKLWYKSLCAMAAVMFCLSFAACNDDDDKTSAEEGSDLTEAQLDSIGYELLMDEVAPYDTTAGGLQRVVSLGTCLYPALADEYYRLADSYAEAKEHFLNILVPEFLLAKVQIVGEVLTLSVLDATVTMRPAEGEGKVAEIDFELPQVTGIKKLYYIERAAWPLNASSPFRKGEICTDANGNYYICAKEADASNGILVTVNVVHRVSVSGVLWFMKLFEKNASKAAFCELRDMNPITMRQALDILETDSTDVKRRAMYEFFDNIAQGASKNYFVGTPSHIFDYSGGRLDFSYYNCYEESFNYFFATSLTDKYYVSYKKFRKLDCEGSSELTFSTSFNRSGWTTVELE